MQTAEEVIKNIRQINFNHQMEQRVYWDTIANKPGAFERYYYFATTRTSFTIDLKVPDAFYNEQQQDYFIRIFQKRKTDPAFDEVFKLRFVKAALFKTIESLLTEFIDLLDG